MKLICTEYHHQIVQDEYTIGPETLHNPYHVPIVSSQLTRSIGVLYPEIRDEISTAFDEVLDLRDNGKHLVPICVCYF